ncbi:hypothetical protein LCGC14_2135470, partial [marine sediment metagenome]
MAELGDIFDKGVEDSKKRIAELEAELAEEHFMHNIAETRLAEADMCMGEAKAQRDKAQKACRVYGGHSAWCRFLSRERGYSKCTCGWKKEKAALSRRRRSMTDEAKEPVCKTCRGRQLYRLLEPTEDE